jgi:hypothetical protein
LHNFRGKSHLILNTAEIGLKIINQPSILHTFVAFWVLFSNNKLQLTTFKDLYKTPIVQRNEDQEFFKCFSLTYQMLLNTVQ